MSLAIPYPGVELGVGTPPTIGEAVLTVQRQLGSLGFACADIRGAKLPRNRAEKPIGDIAGLFGSATAAAVAKFQQARGLHQDGIVGRHTWGALFGAFDTAPAATAAAAKSKGSGREVIDPNALDTDTTKLHPVLRERLQLLQAALRANDVPMRLFEAYRPPERQHKLFAKGKVTKAKPFTSYHQYGCAVDMVIGKEGVNPWETGTAESRRWWKTYHKLAREVGLEPLSWEMPHVQLMGVTSRELLAGRYPTGGDESWADNLTRSIERWTGTPKPPVPSLQDRPPLTPILPMVAGDDDDDAAAADLGWKDLPEVGEIAWGNPFGGKHWRVGRDGIHLEEQEGEPVRSLGNPLTCGAIIEAFGPAIVKAAEKHDVPPEVLVMIIATETGAYRGDGFTGPRTFRWEAHKSDYSAGPVQMLSSTARDINTRAGLGYKDEDFPSFASKPKPAPGKMFLYDAEPAIDLCAAYIAAKRKDTGMNPILISAAYNAGSLKAGQGNAWGIHTYGDHLDRAAQWFGDACDLIGDLRQ